MSNLEQRLAEALRDAAERLPAEGVITVSSSNRRPRRPAIAVLALFALALALLPISLLITSEPSQPAGVSGGIQVRFEPPDIEHLEASDYQRSILRDGVITIEEMQQAMTDHVWCIRRGGFPDVEGWIEADGSTAIYTGGISGAKEAVFDGIFTDCKTEFLEPVRTFYGARYRSQMYLPPELPALVTSEDATCLAQHGVIVVLNDDGSQQWTIDPAARLRGADAIRTSLAACAVIARVADRPYRVPPSPDGD